MIRNLEVIGEAANNLLRSFPDAASRFPNLPLAAMYATRNLLSHGYVVVDPSRVWEIVDRDLKDLSPELDAALRAWDADPQF